ncbi:MAG: hypothetical protein WDN04_13920 [Rhodospirillales bacterium]
MPSPVPSDQINPALITLDDVQGWLGLDGSEPVDVVNAAVAAANTAVRNELGWDPRSLTVIERTDGNGDNTLLMRGKYITAVSQVRLMGGGRTPVVLDLTNIDWDPAEPFIYMPCCVPVGSGNVEVTYTRGCNPLPDDVMQALRITVKAAYDGSLVDHNSTGESWSGVSNKTWQPRGPGTLPPAARTYLTHLKMKF